MTVKKTGRFYKEAGGPQQTHILVRRRYTSSVMFALALRRVSPDMGRSLAQRLRTHQSQIPLRSIEFLDVLIFTSNLGTSGSACKEVIEHIQVCDSQLYRRISHETLSYFVNMSSAFCANQFKER
jgi:hypothetical protein